MSAVFGWFVFQQGPSTAPPHQPIGPESVVWKMVDASNAADPQAYLACYTGDLEQVLRRNVQDMGAEQFRAYLAKRSSAVKGVILSPVEMVSTVEARVRVEYVYHDRNEVQYAGLRKAGDEWRIFRVEGAEAIKSAVPYGMPVSE